MFFLLHKADFRESHFPDPGLFLRIQGGRSGEGVQSCSRARPKTPILPSPTHALDSGANKASLAKTLFAKMPQKKEICLMQGCKKGGRLQLSKDLRPSHTEKGVRVCRSCRHRLEQEKNNSSKTMGANSSQAEARVGAAGFLSVIIANSASAGEFLVFCWLEIARQSVGQCSSCNQNQKKEITFCHQPLDHDVIKVAAQSLDICAVMYLISGAGSMLVFLDHRQVCAINIKVQQILISTIISWLCLCRATPQRAG
jgi:hypothetical protein